MHRQMVDIGLKNRHLQEELKSTNSKPVEEYYEEPKKKKAVWNMDYTEENYDMIKESIQLLRKEKEEILDPIRQENNILNRKL